MEKSFSFAVKVVELVKILSKEKNEYVMTKQILRSGTSIGANVSEGWGVHQKKTLSQKCILLIKRLRKQFIGLICCMQLTTSTVITSIPLGMIVRKLLRYCIPF
jgi:hypothetical protein